MFCKKCGRWNKDEAMFCVECGEAIVPGQPVSTPPADGPAGPQTPPAGAQPKYTPGSMRNRGACTRPCNNTYVWLMAVLPFAATLCTIILVRHSALLSMLVVAMLILLNVVLCIVDNHQFDRKDIASWGWLGAVLPIVYLYVRAAKFDNRYAPAVVNTVLLIVDFITFMGWFAVQTFGYIIELF